MVSKLKKKLYLYLKEKLRDDYLTKYGTDIKCPHCQEWLSISYIEGYEHRYLPEPNFGYLVICGKCTNSAYWNTQAFPIPVLCDQSGQPLKDGDLKDNDYPDLMNNNCLMKKIVDYMKERYRNDPEFKTLYICRNILHRTLKATNQTKNSPTAETVGYTHLDLKQYLESLFQPNMTWDNFGTEWHIDHKYPVSRYIKDGIEDPKIINALDNLLPMWAEHNMEKGDMTLEEYLEVRPDLKEVYGNG